LLQQAAVYSREAYSQEGGLKRESLLEWADEELLKEIKEKEEVIKVNDEAFKDKDGSLNFLLRKSRYSREDYEAFLKSEKAEVQ
jgi:hypothetical protein